MANPNTSPRYNRYGNLVRTTAFWLAPLALTAAACSSTSEPGLPNVQISITSSTILLHAQDIDRALNGAIQEITARGGINQTGDSTAGPTKTVEVTGVPLDTSQLGQHAANSYNNSTGILELATTYDSKGNFTDASIIEDVTCGSKLQTVTTVHLTQSGGSWSISEAPGDKSASTAIQDDETLLGKFNTDFASVTANNGEHAITLVVPPGTNCG